MLKVQLAFIDGYAFKGNMEMASDSGSVNMHRRQRKLDTQIRALTVA